MDQRDVDILARLEGHKVEIEYLKKAVDECRAGLTAIRREYVRLERYIRVEIAVFGVIALILGALVTYAMGKLLS